MSKYLTDNARTKAINRVSATKGDNADKLIKHNFDDKRNLLEVYIELGRDINQLVDINKLPSGAKLPDGRLMNVKTLQDYMDALEKLYPDLTVAK